jgi:hypothetical protein
MTRKQGFIYPTLTVCSGGREDIAQIQVCAQHSCHTTAQQALLSSKPMPVYPEAATFCHRDMNGHIESKNPLAIPY